MYSSLKVQVSLKKKKTLLNSVLLSFISNLMPILLYIKNFPLHSVKFNQTLYHDPWWPSIGNAYHNITQCAHMHLLCVWCIHTQMKHWQIILTLTTGSAFWCFHSSLICPISFYLSNISGERSIYNVFWPNTQ